MPHRSENTNTDRGAGSSADTSQATPEISRQEARRKETREESCSDAASDMTPMIDVVFLLIIFFLCIDFRVLESKLPAYLPKDRGSSPYPLEPQPQLTVKIVCDQPGEEVLRPGGRSHRLDGHRVHYELGPTRGIASIGELRSVLQREKDRPRADPLGREATVTIQPGPGVVYGDVAPAVDAVAAAGFAEIHFGGSLR